MTIQLIVNGKPREIEQEMDLPEFLRELSIDERLVAVAYNGDVIPRGEYARVRLHAGDALEIVRMVGGG